MKINNLKNKKLEIFYLCVFFICISGFCYSNIMYHKYYNEQRHGVSWHCHKCNTRNWKQDPPYKCSQCGCLKGNVK